MEYNFVHTHTTNRDLELIFEPFTQADILIVLEDNDTLESALVRAKLFTSLTQARKNGHSGIIPIGYSERKFGKHRLFFYIPDFNWIDSYLQYNEV